MPVITLSRQFGAAGAPIGRKLADRFGAEYLDREVVAMVAERSGIPEEEAEGYDERLPGLWQRIAAALATSAPEVAMPPLPSGSLPDTEIGERLAALTRAVVEEAAARGNAVILGRGAAFILGRRPDALHVQLHASSEARLRYLLMRAEDIPSETRPDEKSLRELCRSFDRARGNYLKRRFDVDWMDARNYDLALDTGRLGIDTSVELIEAAARGLQQASDLPPPAA
ncbi:MAG: cytidylate kinase-like family protein [Chloroflexi bacterium]|nr:cytidylate kinase-like family protein [Chloroflexota bacterium]